MQRAGRLEPTPAPCAGAPPTLGVEEEFLLVDPDTGLLVPRAAQVIRDCSRPGRVVAESMTYMVETRTGICRGLGEVRRDLGAMRDRVSAAAREEGAVGVPCAVPPFGTWPDPPLVSDHGRYLELARRFPWAMSTAGTCACHVHVGVPDRDAGVQVLLRLRPWLPALVALSASSPIQGGHDTSWASHRLALVSRWPTGRPAPPVTTLDEYDRALRDPVADGRALDDRSVYWFARLSPRYPTVELRVADVAQAVDDVVAFAALVRGLVATALDDRRRGVPVVAVPQSRLARACLVAACNGPCGRLLDPVTDEVVDGWAMLRALAAVAGPRLRSLGDEDTVLSALDRARTTGGAAARMRRVFAASGSPGTFVTALSRAMSTTHPVPAG